MSIVQIAETTVQDGQGGTKVVRSGDSVKRLSPELYPHSEDDDSWEHFAREEFKSLGELLDVEEPYVIRWIGRWPCGEDMLYFEPRGAGSQAKKFQCAM